MDFKAKMLQYIKRYSYISLILITIIVACIMNPDLFEVKKQCNIQLNAIYDDTITHGQQVWLTQILINNENVPLSDLDIISNENWEYAADCDDYVFYPDTEINDNLLEFCIEGACDVDLVFITSNWSGSVGVITEKKSTNIALYSDEIGRATHQISEEDFKTLYLSNIVPFLGIVILIMIFVAELIPILRNLLISNKLIGVCELLSFDILRRYIKPHERILKRIGLILTSEIIFLYLIANDLNDLFEKDAVVIVMALIACADYFYIHMRDREGMQIYFSKKSKILIAGCSAYAAFAIVGHKLFLYNEKFALSKGINFLLSIGIIYPVIFLIIHLLKKINSCKLLCETKEINVNRFRIQCFCVMFFPLLIISLGYYPGNMGYDGLTQWLMALGRYPLQDNHPAIHTLFFKLCFTIYPSIYNVVIIHIIMFCLIWTKFFIILYKKNINKKVLLSIAILICLMPNSYMMLCMHTKNTFYAIIILWNMILIAEIIEYKNNFFSKWNTFQYIMALSFLYTVRHNGFLATYMIIIMLIILGIKYRKFSKNIFFIVLGTIIMICVIRGPLYETMGVKQISGKTSVSPLYRPAGMFILNDIDIPENVQNIVESIGTKEQWKKYYNPYNGDLLGWSELKGNISRCSLSDSFRLYFALLKKNPGLVISDRLKGTDLLWNVVEPTKEYQKYGIINNRYTIGIVGWKDSKSDIGFIFPPALLNAEHLSNSYYFKENIFTNLGKTGITLARSSQITDLFMFRNGVYIIIMFILTIYNIIECNWRKNLIIYPSFITLITLLLVISWQIYEYCWFFSISITLFFLYTSIGNVKDQP